MNRRTFFQTAAAVAAAARSAGAQTKLPIQKAVLYSMLPKDLSIEDRFRLAHECGFAAIECGTEDDEATAQRMLRAAQSAGIHIHSVMNRDHWKYPLSSSDPAVVDKSLACMKTSLHNAKLWGATTVLLVPAVVNPETSYREAWERSQQQIGKLIPIAEELQIIIAVEEVWNKFLLSPLEFARYVDDFSSPWLRSYFDVGNVVLYGYPQDWIRTLGPRIAKLHLKDFRIAMNRETHQRCEQWVNLRDGDIDWKAVHDALAAIGYKGTATVELQGGDRAYLTDVSHRFDQILAGGA